MHVEFSDAQMERVKRVALDEGCNLKQLVMRELDMILDSRGLAPFARYSKLSNDG